MYGSIKNLVQWFGYNFHQKRIIAIVTNSLTFILHWFKGGSLPDDWKKVKYLPVVDRIIVKWCEQKKSHTGRHQTIDLHHSDIEFLNPKSFNVGGCKLNLRLEIMLCVDTKGNILQLKSLGFFLGSILDEFRNYIIPTFKCLPPLVWTSDRLFPS